MADPGWGAGTRPGGVYGARDGQGERVAAVLAAEDPLRVGESGFVAISLPGFVQSPEDGLAAVGGSGAIFSAIRHASDDDSTGSPLTWPMELGHRKLVGTVTQRLTPGDTKPTMFVLDLTGEPGTVVVSPADTRPDDDGGGDDDDLEEGQVTAVVLGPVTTAIEFPGLADFDFSGVPVGGTGIQVVPPIFSHETLPKHYGYSQGSAFGKKPRSKRAPLAKIRFGEPIKPASEITISEDDASEVAVMELFRQRPVWSRDALTAYMDQDDLNKVKRILMKLAYHFADGPWRAMWTLKGYDPALHKEAWKYQVVDVRPERAATVTDASVEHKRAVVAGAAAPPKKQFVYQLVDLMDDARLGPVVRAQEETLRDTCSAESGWLEDKGILKEIRDALHDRFSRDV